MDWQTSEVVLRRQLWVNSRWSYKELLTKEDLSHVGQPVPCPLAPDEKAYALVSAIQHGDRSVPYWIQQGHAEQKVVAELVDVVIHGPHRRPSLRAARALEAVDMHVLNETTARLADGNPVMDDWRIELVTAAAGTGEVERLLREGGTDKWRLRADELEATIAELATYPRRGPPRLSQNV
jgi:hypothetical protein